MRKSVQNVRAHSHADAALTYVTPLGEAYFVLVLKILLTKVLYEKKEIGYVAN
jgi:hypothetical protein